MKKRQKVGTTYVIPTIDLAEAVAPAQLVDFYVERALVTLSTKSPDIDWTTLDLRIFRDVDLETQQRDEHLTLRAQALTKKETP